MKKLYIGYYTIKNSSGNKIVFKYFDKNMKQFFSTYDSIRDSIQDDINNHKTKNIIGYTIREYDYVNTTYIPVKEDA